MKWEFWLLLGFKRHRKHSKNGPVVFCENWCYFFFRYFAYLWSSLSQSPSMRMTHCTLPIASWPWRDLKNREIEGNILKAPNNEVLYFIGSFTSPTRIFPSFTTSKLFDILPIFQKIKKISCKFLQVSSTRFITKLPSNWPERFDNAHHKWIVWIGQAFFHCQSRSYLMIWHQELIVRL